ncbi:MAG: hypothetical protein ACHP83_08910 [Burkholderiales bacterium]
MRWPVHFMILALAAGTSLAQGADPLKSAECVQALEALQAQEVAMIAAAQHKDAGDEQAAPPPLATFEALQKDAAHACLGSRLDAPPPVQRLARPPITVAPITPHAAALAVVPPAPAAAPPPIQVPPVKTITVCDPAGCWASDGTRLNRMGTMLVGPLGLCTVQGAVLSCQ